MEEEKLENMTLGQLTSLQAEKYPNREAVVDVRQNRRLTYGQLKELSGSLAGAVLRLGMEKGDHVAVIMDNCWETIVTKIAVARAGGVIVNLNIHEKAGMLEMLLKRADVKMIFIKQGIKAREHMEMMYEICPELRESSPGRLNCRKLPKLRHVIVTDPARPHRCAWQFEELLEQGETMDQKVLKYRESLISPGDVATIIHTSGTSGVSKGVVLCHEQLIRNAENHVRVMKLTEKDRFCTTAPMFHSLGCVGSVLTCITAGAALVCYDRPEGFDLFEILKKEKCTVLCSVPTVYIRLLKLVKEEMQKANSKVPGLFLRLCVTAGAPCPRQTLMDMKEVLGAGAVITMYGMTEAGPGIASTGLEDSIDTVFSGAGRLWPGVKAKIRSLDTGGELTGEETGEICIKSPCVMKEYYNSPEETAKAIDEEGWLHTGDLGYFTDKGLLVLKGRCKDLIIRGGENISPKEVEEFLNLHEDIEAAAVVGAPDEQYGEMVYAFLKLKPGKTMDQKELEQWCRGRIATIKIPQEIAVVEDFPVSATGKIAKGQLRKTAEERIRKNAVS